MTAQHREPPVPAAPGPNRRKRVGGAVPAGVVIVAVVLAAFGIWTRTDHVDALSREAEDAAIPRVQVIEPGPGPKQRSLVLPGNLNAWYQAPIYAQVAGYVKMWYKDFGAPVKAGDLLAVIDSPTVDAQLAQAKANLEVAETQYKLADVTARRYQALSGTQAVSQQDVDVQTAAAAARKAQVDAATHEVARWEAQHAFERVVAPFDGVVTSRSTDVGDYVNAGGGDLNRQGSASELFSVADIHAIRLFVSVPQDYSDVLKPGLTATFTLPQNPGETFKATYLTTANAVSTQTRTVTVEFVVQNPNHELWPGSFASVKMVVPGDPRILVVPEQALLFRSQGMQVALLDAQDRVHLQNVTLGLNLGKTVQVLAGLKPNDRIINNPSLGLLEGQQVKTVQAVAGYNDGPVAPRGQPARAGNQTVEPAPGGDEPEAGVKQ
ncbi:efflux RND transporter periplasmic adaptor subunit [Acetobacteraceae bacterium KSS8]|uniref:Efflux RND transporter periplasmic adaptor subunit n=1 Tax=Endosaccharibacter trunci TaxID=2812733 RepID=A0ABT1W248_9PROT|nr:efflux RND transporter periplasmic adaptor subunit [Acetobacteraceae bacterium KSS8]